MASTSASLSITVQSPQGEIVLPFQPGTSLRDILLAGGVAVRSSCAGVATCGLCQVRVAESAMLPFTLGERRRLSSIQLGEGIRLSCQLVPETDLHVSLALPEVKMNWRALREDEFSKALPFALRESGVRYGVAIDLGTTHIRLTFWDLFAGERIAGRACLNPQGSYGADVLLRLMEAARSINIFNAIKELVLNVIADALAEIAVQLAIKLDEVGEILLVGNTAMLSLLSGKNYAELLDPQNWTRCIDCQPEDTGFLSKAWGINQNTQIRFVAPLGGFIGSDLLAGVLATRLIEQPAGSLLIDFGTNSEMALWDGHTLHVTATAGGPAFEGSGISCGMQGETGAIFRVDDAVENNFSLQVLGDVEPQGICGSGLIDAIAWLRRKGQLDKVGRFTRRESEGMVLYEGTQRIVLKRSDIDVMQRAKAAIGGGVQWLCRQAGMSVNALHAVYASGAFGRLLKVENAQQIGLLPALPADKVYLEGNTALAGCEALLTSEQAEQALAAIMAVSKVYNLAEDEGFEALFVENLYLQTLQD